MKRKRYLGLLLIFGVLVISLTFYTLINSDNPNGKLHSSETLYENTNELVDNSDTIIKGTVQKIYKPTKELVESSLDKKVFSIVVKSDINVEKVLKGNIDKQNKITVEKNIGYEIDGLELYNNDIENYSENETVMLFLKKSDTKDKYFPINKYQYKIAVKNGKIGAYNVSSINENYLPMFSNMTYIEIEEKIQKAISIK